MPEKQSKELEFKVIPLTEEEIPEDVKRVFKLHDLSRNYKKKLKDIGEKLGFKTAFEWKIQGGSIDVVWCIEKEIPTICQIIPIVAFELETSSRTRKHIKGDIFNLQLLNASFNIVIFLKEGFKNEKEFESLLKVSKIYAKTIKNTYIWTEKEIDEWLEKIKSKD